VNKARPLLLQVVTAAIPQKTHQCSAKTLKNYKIWKSLNIIFRKIIKFLKKNDL
jgi:hypothetical protein